MTTPQLDPELIAILNDAQRAYQEGLDDANPAPEDGEYVMLLRDVSVKRITPKAGGPDAAPTAIMTLAFKVLGHPVYTDYGFKSDFWGSNSQSMGQFSTFAACAVGRPVPTVAEAYSVLLASKGEVAFHVKVSRFVAKKTGNTYVNLSALRRVDLTAQAA